MRQAGAARSDSVRSVLRVCVFLMRGRVSFAHV